MSPLIDIQIDNKLRSLMFELIAKILPITVTVFCYLLTYKKLSQYSVNGFSIGMNYSRLIWYPICQIFLYGPLLTNEMYKIMFGLQSFYFDWAVVNIFQFAGLVNSMAYMFKRTKYRTNYIEKYNYESSDLSVYSVTSKTNQEQSLL